MNKKSFYIVGLLTCNNFFFSFSQSAFTPPKKCFNDISFKNLNENNNDIHQFEMKIFAWRTEDEMGKKKIIIRHDSKIEILSEYYLCNLAKITTTINGKSRTWTCICAKIFTNGAYIDKKKYDLLKVEFSQQQVAITQALHQVKTLPQNTKMALIAVDPPNQVLISQSLSKV